MGRFRSSRLAWTAPLVLLAGSARAEVQVALRDGRVDVAARSAPLSEVLDRLGQQTRMEVTYDGAPPRQLVTATVEAATPAQAVLAVLEGLGVNYALQLDASGREVRSLLVIAPKTGSAPARPAAPAPAARVLPPMDDEEPPVVEEDEPVPTNEVRPRPDRFRPGRDRMERPGAFEPAAPSQAPAVTMPAPTQAYPVSPFAPVAPPPIQQLAPPPPSAPPEPQPDEE
jgi:hypothetical protein